MLGNRAAWQRFFHDGLLLRSARATQKGVAHQFEAECGSLRQEKATFSSVMKPVVHVVRQIPVHIGIGSVGRLFSSIALKIAISVA
jgi:hypothetical protein